MRFGMRRGAGDAQQVLGGRRPQHRVDVDAFLQQRLAEPAQVQLVLDHHRHDGGLAGQHAEAPRPQLVAQQLRDAQQPQPAAARD